MSNNEINKGRVGLFNGPNLSDSVFCLKTKNRVFFTKYNKSYSLNGPDREAIKKGSR